MAVFRRGKVWWYEFLFAGRRVRESAKTTSKTVAKDAEKKRHRELEKGFNGLEDTRDERIKTLKELTAAYLKDYRLRHRSVTFAVYAVRNVTRHLGQVMAVDVTDKTVKNYQAARLKEKAAPKTINEEVGFLLRLLGEAGDPIRARLRRQKSLKLAIRNQVGKAFSPEEKARLLEKAKEARSPAIYPALMLALNAGMRDAEIRELQWGRVDLSREFLTVGESKTEAGEGRTIPLNSALLEAMVDYSKWYTKRFHTIKPEWYVFPARIGTPSTGQKRPLDPTKPMVTLKTSWNNVKTKARVKGRWHDNRHTLITDLAESGAGDETIRDIAGHVSRQMLKHYSHIRMEAKRTALESIVAKKADSVHPAQDLIPPKSASESDSTSVLN
jgi:integrase